MTQSKCILRLLTKRLNSIRKYSQTDIKIHTEPSKTVKSGNRFVNLIENNKDKILFNTYLDHEKVRLGRDVYYYKQCEKQHKERKKEAELKKIKPLPLSLKYIVGEDRLLKDNIQAQDLETEHQEIFQLPFAKPAKVKTERTENKKVNQEEFNQSNLKNWMTDYDCFDDAILDSSELSDDEVENDELGLNWGKLYGTPDPDYRISNVPCFGCGALLHCNDTSIPGYLPSELIKNRSRNELKMTECQRCHFLKEFNIALNISVDPEEYETLLQNIKYKKALVILMVDLLDFPCSIWPGIVDIIGTERPLIIVGNKVDLLPGDSEGYLKRIEQSLRQEINKTNLKTANIKAVSLISAKTGYGVEELISNMFKVWLCKGDVFLIGCTNVGKSSLFNALLQSDYCKVQAHDLIQRATVSRWPGTTLNLLKFPINRISGYKNYIRTQRLKRDSNLLKTEKKLRQLQLGEKNPDNLPTLIDRIGRSFVDHERALYTKDLFSYGGSGQVVNQQVLNEKHPALAQSKWFYDTPGVVHPDQILSLLTAEELLLTTPKDLIRPQTFFLKEGTTIFIGGIARVDFLECKYPCRFTIFTSSNLPITITKFEDADSVYTTFLGTDLLGVPKGNKERMGQWPGLKKHDNDITFLGEGNTLCCGDIVLSSAGWISVTAPNDLEVKLSAWTPEARGIHLRIPSMLQHAVMLKGRRVRDTPAYRIGHIYVGDEDKKRKRKLS